MIRNKKNNVCSTSGDDFSLRTVFKEPFYPLRYTNEPEIAAEQLSEKMKV